MRALKYLMSYTVLGSLWGTIGSGADLPRGIYFITRQRKIIATVFPARLGDCGRHRGGGAAYDPAHGGGLQDDFRKTAQNESISSAAPRRKLAIFVRERQRVAVLRARRRASNLRGQRKLQAVSGHGRVMKRDPACERTVQGASSLRSEPKRPPASATAGTRPGMSPSAADDKNRHA